MRTADASLSQRDLATRPYTCEAREEPPPEILLDFASTPGCRLKAPPGEAGVISLHPTPWFRVTVERFLERAYRLYEQSRREPEGSPVWMRMFDVGVGGTRRLVRFGPAARGALLTDRAARTQRTPTDLLYTRRIGSELWNLKVEINREQRSY